MDGTVSSDFPPERLIKSCVLPVALSPTTPIYLLAVLVFLFQIMMNAMINTITAMMQIRQLDPDCTSSASLIIISGFIVSLKFVELSIGVLIFILQQLYPRLSAQTILEVPIAINSLCSFQGKIIRVFGHLGVSFVIVITNNMNKNQRMLPQLTACFLQKKAYDAHRKKIDYIRQSLINPMVKKEAMSCEISAQKPINCTSSNKMSTINQQLPYRLEKISPWEKRKIQGYNRQNMRLIKKIQTCSSTIKKKDMNEHMVRSKQILNRISKFQVDPQTNKARLKSVHSLNLLTKIKPNRERDNSIKRLLLNHSKFQGSKSIGTKQSRHSFENSQKSRQMLNKKSSFDNFMNRRNSQRVNNHFSRQNYASKLRVKLSPVRSHTSTQVKPRRLTEPLEPYYKSRCFTTQPQNV